MMLHLFLSPKVLFALATALLLGGAIQAAPTTPTAPATSLAIPPSPAAIAALEASNLSRGDLSADAYAFKQQVYRLHVARGVASGRERIYDLAPAQLALIPGTDISMRRDAAEHLGLLLAAANADLGRDLAMIPATPEQATPEQATPEQVLRQKRARRVRELGVGNAYRSASRQFGIWDRNFAGYYAATQEKRAALPGGEHGAAAAELLREYIGIRVAAPGFSNHQGGIAVDLALRLLPEGDKAAPDLGASMAQADPWHDSWFWNWLKGRAGEFGFVEYEPEAWHWEYKPEQIAKEARLAERDLAPIHSLPRKRLSGKADSPQR